LSQLYFEQGVGRFTL